MEGKKGKGKIRPTKQGASAIPHRHFPFPPWEGAGSGGFDRATNRQASPDSETWGYDPFHKGVGGGGVSSPICYCSYY